MNRLEIEQVVQDLQDAKAMVRECQSRLTDQLLGAPKEVLVAINLGLTKPNFAVSSYFYRELRSILKQQ